MKQHDAELQELDTLLPPYYEDISMTAKQTQLKKELLILTVSS